MLEGEIIEITELLLGNPGQSFISKDGKRLYILEQGRVICLEGPIWGVMTEEQINNYLQERTHRNPWTGS